MYPMPQKVADSRHIESEFKPYKKIRKFIHTEENGEWSTKEVNGW